MAKYVALLRGINVGGKTKVSMESLRKLFASLGYKNIKTFINSGNVIFESDEGIASVEQKVSLGISGSIGNFKVMVRTNSSLKQIVSSFPSKIDDRSPLFVTFFEKKPKSAEKPQNSSGMEIVAVKGKDVIWLRKPSAKAYDDIEKLFGASGTTRNLNTVKKLSQL